MFRNLMLAIIIALGLSTVTSAATLTIDTTGNKPMVTGITGVSHGGKTYDAVFNHGSFDSLALAYLPIAPQLNRALFEAFTAYESVSNHYLNDYNVQGCTSLRCILRTPYYNNSLSNTRVTSSIVVLDNLKLPELVLYDSRWRMMDLHYAVWTEVNVSPVPVPAAVFMFAPALLGFLGLRRRQRAA